MLFLLLFKKEKKKPVKGEKAVKYQTLKITEELHRKLKIACVEAQTTLLDATDQMVKAWVEDVERRKLDPLQEKPTKETRATRQKNEKPNPHPEHAASGQKGIPKRARQKANSTKPDLGES